MKLAAYLHSLLPNFGKSRLLSDIDCIRKELKEQTLPPLVSLSEAFGKRKFKNQWVNDFNQTFMREVPIKVTGNYLNGVRTILETVAENLDIIERLVDEYYADDVVRDGMTLIRVNILQYLETMSFATAFTRRLLVLTMGLEEMEFAQPDEDLPYTQGEFSYINEHLTDYLTALTILSGNKQALDERFKAMPDMTVNEHNVASTAAVIGPVKMDPFGFGFIGVSMNPIYHIRIMYAEHQVLQYKRAKEQRQLLEFKLLRLKQLDTGKTDARLEQQIAYTQARVDKLTSEIREMEDQYA